MKSIFFSTPDRPAKTARKTKRFLHQDQKPTIFSC